MVLYTLISEEEISNYVKHFSIGKLVDYESLGGGSTNSNYIVKTLTEKYILTIFEDKTFNQTEILVNLLCHLENHNFPTSRLIKDIKGKYINSYHGKPVLLKQYIAGNMVNLVTDNILLQVGKLMAQLHSIPVPIGISEYFSYGIQHFSTIISDDNQKDSFAHWLARMKKFLLDNLPDGLPSGLVHGDIFGDNIIENNGLVTIIDFEEFFKSPFVFDIGMAIVGTCFENNILSLTNVKQLIKGYQEIRILQKLEKENIRLFAIYGAVATAFWRYKQFNLLFPEMNQSMKYKQMVKFADTLYNIDNNKFMNKIL